MDLSLVRLTRANRDLAILPINASHETPLIHQRSLELVNGSLGSTYPVSWIGRTLARRRRTAERAEQLPGRVH
jgi:hypothetical protein